MPEPVPPCVVFVQGSNVRMFLTPTTALDTSAIGTSFISESLVKSLDIVSVDTDNGYILVDEIKSNIVNKLLAIKTTIIKAATIPPTTPVVRRKRKPRLFFWFFSRELISDSYAYINCSR